MCSLKSSKFETGCGRGPTRFISPRITLKNWGSSSSRYFRSHFPTRVIRLVLSPAHSEVGPSTQCMVRKRSEERRAHAILDEKHGSPRIDLDRQRHEGDQRSEDNQTDDRDQQANAAAGREVNARLSEVAGKDERARGEGFDGELAGETFVDMETVLDDASPQASLQEIANR